VVFHSIHAHLHQPKCYSPRNPERTLLYQTVAEHFETWLHLASAGPFDALGDLLLCQQQGDVAESVGLTVELGQSLQPLIHASLQRWLQGSFHQVEHFGRPWPGRE